MTPPSPRPDSDPADSRLATLLTNIANLDLDSADGWAGIKSALLEMERLHPGCIERMNAGLQLRRLRREGATPN